MNTILFDIDGTLIRSGNAGMIAIAQAMKELFGISEVAKVELHGRTDNGILSDLFAAHELSFDEHRDEFSQRYWTHLPAVMKERKGELLPGVTNLLEFLDRSDSVAVGILTGNAKRAAQIKLEHFGIESYFAFGGYGDIHSSRNDVAKLAFDSAEEHLGENFDPERLWVIGDTVNDITCARSIGSKVVAVETGGCDPGALGEAKPDLQMETLQDTSGFVQKVLGLSVE